MNIAIIGDAIEIDGVRVATLAPGATLNYGAMDALQEALDAYAAQEEQAQTAREEYEKAWDAGYKQGREEAYRSGEGE